MTIKLTPIVVTFWLPFSQKNIMTSQNVEVADACLPEVETSKSRLVEKAE